MTIWGNLFLIIPILKQFFGANFLKNRVRMGRKNGGFFSENWPDI